MKFIFSGPNRFPSEYRKRSVRLVRASVSEGSKFDRREFERTRRLVESISALYSQRNESAFTRFAFIVCVSMRSRSEKLLATPRERTFSTDIPFTSFCSLISRRIRVLLQWRNVLLLLIVDEFRELLNWSCWS